MSSFSEELYRILFASSNEDPPALFEPTMDMIMEDYHLARSFRCGGNKKTQVSSIPVTTTADPYNADQS
jgi:hypothetical protein